MHRHPALLSLINISSPRRLDDRMLAALKVYAKARQAMIITPFILSGAMAPVSVAGTLAQLNAEALAGITLAQMINPGTPVIYGRVPDQHRSPERLPGLRLAGKPDRPLS